MNLYITLLISVVCGALHSEAIKAQYDDDTTPHKVRLEDLEDEQQLPQPQHHEQQEQYSYNNHLPDIQRQPQLSIYTPTANSAATPAPQRPKQPAPKKVKFPSEDYETAAANRFLSGHAPFVYNGIDVDEQRRPQATQPATDYHQLSDGYALKQTPAAYVLVPPFAGVDVIGEDDGISAERNRHSPTAYHLRRPLSPLYGDNQPAPPTIVSYAPNEPSAIAPPPPPSPLPPQPQPQPTATPPQAVAAAATFHSGVRYLNGNYLSNEALPEEEPADEPDSLIYTREYLLPGRPRIIYGPPPASHRSPVPSPSYAQTQSNQLAYAPARRPDAGALPTTAALLPYPPSFISITTRAPPNAHGAQSPALATYYSRQFRPSQVDSLPDLFASRQHKSLLDSYIPSWVVAQMLQQQQQRGSYGYHTLVYPIVAPHTSRHFKRDLESNATRLATDRAERAPVARKIVKKSLNKPSSVDEEMLMTE